MFNIEEIPEESPTTGSSSAGSTTPTTGGSTEGGEPVQALDVPDYKLADSNWRLDELKKLLSKQMRKKVSVFYHVIRKPSLHTAEMLVEAKSFFNQEFPDRSPYATYQKAMRINRGGYKRIILI